jgi:maltose alpha-D-glucosyltransferase / alpha-amylase
MEYSLQYAAAATMRDQVRDRPKRAEWARCWSSLARAAFRNEYLWVMGDSYLLPRGKDDFEASLLINLVAKAAYQVGYELEDRPSWVPVAVKTLFDLFAENS